MSGRKNYTRIAIILSAITVILILLVYSANMIIENRVKKALKNYIDTTPDRLYDYEYESIDINIAGADATLRGVRIIPRQNAIDSLQQNKLRTLLYLDIGELLLDDLGLFDLLFNKSVDIDLLELDDVEVRNVTNHEVPPTPSSVVVRDIFAENVRDVFIDELSINNASVILEIAHSSDSIFLDLDSVNISVDEIFIDKSTVEKLQPFTYEKIALFVKQISGGMVEGYDISADSLTIDTDRSLIDVCNFSFMPKQFNIEDTTKQFTRNAFMVKVNDVMLSPVDFKGWVEDGFMRIGHIFIDEPSITVSMDRHWPKPMYERLLPANNIRSIPIPVMIDTLTVSKGYVFYKEIYTDGKLPLEIFFTNMHASGFNITNDSTLLKEKPLFRLYANADVLGEGHLKLDARFPILSPTDSFMMKVTMDTLDVNVLDPIMEGQLKANLEGKINSLMMDFGADKFASSGTLELDYSGLKLEFFKLKTNKKGQEVKHQKFINVLVNPLIKSNNIKDTPGFRTGEINYERPLHMSFFSILWQSLKSGLVTTLMPEKKSAQAKEKAKVEKKQVKEERKEVGKQEKGSQKAQPTTKKQKQKKNPSLQKKGNNN